MNFTLEKYKIFPYIAWIIFICFAAFVGNLALQLYEVTSELSESSVDIERIARENAERLDALEAKLNSETE